MTLLLTEDHPIEQVRETLQPWLWTAAAVVLVAGILFAVQRALRASGLARRRSGTTQATLLALTLVGLLIVLLSTPLEKETRGQLLGFLGIVLSAAIALSSTTLLGNALAGVMLRAVRNFKVGDFVRVGEVFGRVSDRGVVHTEIQTEDSDLVTLPHLYLVTNPVTVVRSSGTIVSATVSLGYDVPRARVEELLVEAARATELEEPFVQVLDLLDHAVVYRVAGLLREVGQLITTRSRLRKRMLDALHEGGVEIVSPGFTNMRRYDPERRFVPARERAPAPEQPETAAEDLAFQKAEEAASLEALRDMLGKLQDELRDARDREKKAAGDERAALTAAAEALDRRVARLTARLEARERRAREE